MTDEFQKIVKELSNSDVWAMFALLKSELKKRKLVSTNNITGERGEFLAIEIYTKTPNLPKLQKAPESTQNVDALSFKGDRYSIKTITAPGKTTGVFYGIELDDKNPLQKFEFLIIVILDSNMNPVNIYELTWQQFLKYKKWHSRMRALNIPLTKDLIFNSKIIL